MVQMFFKNLYLWSSVKSADNFLFVVKPNPVNLRSMKQFLSYRSLRFPVAAVLIFAALTKVWQTATEPADGMPWLAMGHVLFESGLTLLLLSGIWPRLVKWATIIVFAVFFCVAVHLAMKSAASCGCFGNVQVDPKITAGLDALIVLLLILSSAENQWKRPSRKQVMFVAVGMFFALLLLIPMSLHPPVQRVDHGTVVDETLQQDETPQQTDDSDRKAEPPWTSYMPRDFQIGYVEPKSIHRFTLEIANPTDQTLPLDAVETECECLLVVEKPEHLTPGKSPLTLEFTTPDIVGSYSKTITAVSGSQRWTTRFHARVDMPLSTDPETLVFTLGETEQLFTIKNDGRVPVRLLYATTSPPICGVKIGAEPIPAGETLTLAVTLLEPQARQTAVLHINTNHKHQKILRIPIHVVE